VRTPRTTTRATRGSATRTATPTGGDCDDWDDRVHPDQAEECEDLLDNDCDGFFDEQCESAVQRGSLLGGSACGGASGAWLLVAPLPLLLWRGRRR
jgi:hypothetical protein